jgi:beta-glucosidase
MRDAHDIVSRLTPEERLDMLDGDVDFWDGLVDLIGGGYTEHTFPGASARRLGIGGIEFSDGPRGAVIGIATCFPVSMARGATWDPELEERIGEAIGKEIRAKGANLYGGVCVNLLAHPAWGRAQETYGEDPVLLGELGAALARGAQRHVMACVKHFALNSMENARFQVDITVDEATLHEVYLPHFRRIIDEGTAVVMSAYNSVNGSWAGESVELLHDVLRGEWGFEGIVISDWIYGIRDAAASVVAGMDVEMPYRMVRHQHLRRQIDEGLVTWEHVDAACTRIVSTLDRFAPVLEASKPDPGVIACEEHIALAHEAARRAIVLLRNERELLPLDPTARMRIAVIGDLAARPNLGDLGSSRVQPPATVTPLDGVRSAFPFAEVVFDDGTDPARASALAADCDVAIVVAGCTSADEGEYVGLEGSAHLYGLYPPQPEGTSERLTAAIERGAVGDRSFGKGGDRTDLRLPGAQESLIRAVAAANPDTVVALMGGSAFITEAWREHVAATLVLWYPGMEGGRALGDVLSGVFAPEGRLPFTMPADEAQLQPFDAQATSVRYDRWVGYRRFDKFGHQPAYPFGFGLTYGDLVLAGSKVDVGTDAFTVDVSVEHRSGRPTRDLVQVYAGPVEAEPDREALVLVGFARTPDLTAGNSVPVRIDVPIDRLAVRREGSWHLRPGAYRVVVARHHGDPEAHEHTIMLSDNGMLFDKAMLNEER